MRKNDKILIAGSSGLVGSALLRLLSKYKYSNLLTPTSRDLDLRKEEQVSQYFDQIRPKYVFLCAAKVGGIIANKNEPVAFIKDNLRIQNNVIEHSFNTKVKKLVFLGSSCIYPKIVEQPIKEEYLLTGKLEPTNKPYAIAKIAGIELCQAYKNQYDCNFVSVMPTNLYGRNDNFNLTTSHLAPALIRKFHEAKVNDHATVTLWGSGSPYRELLHVDDLAKALVIIMEKYDDIEPINVGYGSDIKISRLAMLIQRITGHKGNVEWDVTKPDGTPRKLLDITKITNMGWQPQISLVNGLNDTYEWWKTTI